jgi:hypothetical protein
MIAQTVHQRRMREKNTLSIPLNEKIEGIFLITVMARFPLEWKCTFLVLSDIHYLVKNFPNHHSG